MSNPTIIMGGRPVEALIVEYKRLKSDILPYADEYAVYVHPELYAALRHRGMHVKAKMIERYRLTGKRVRR